MTLRIKNIGGGFVIDDGEGLRLTECPCCDLPFTRAAAEAIVRNVDAAKLTVEELRIAVAVAERMKRGKP